MDLTGKQLSVTRQSELLNISRSTVYYKKKGERKLNKNLKKMIKEKFELQPFYGVPRMTAYLRKDKNLLVNKKRVERLYKELGLQTIMPKKNLSKPNKKHKKYPYLLRELDINRVNQVWQTDITYIPMKSGFMYLTAVIDVFSRHIVSWSVSNTMSAQWCAKVVKSAIDKHGNPEILNTDQGSQYTSEIFINQLTASDVKISMDGKGRALDNIYIERFWRSVKYEDLFLNCYENGLTLHKGFKKYIHFYNHQRRHQSLDYETPASIFFKGKMETETA